MRRASAPKISEEPYRAVVEDLTEIICRFQADGTITFVNDVFCRFFGKPAAELLGKKWHPVALPEDLPRIEAELRTLSPANPVLVIENRVYDGSGNVRWMQFVNRGFFDSHGRLTETQAVGRDITERKQTEAALRVSEERFRIALAAAPIVVFNQDCELRYTWIGNPALGLKPEEAIGRTDEDLLGAEMATPLIAIKRRVLESGVGERQEVHIVREGQAGCFDLMVEPLRRTAGQIVGITCVAVDITGRKRAELALRESELRFAAVFQNSPVAIGISRLSDGKFLNVNDAFVRLYGYTREEIIGHTSAELGLWHSGNRAAVVRNLREQRRRQMVDMQGRCKHGDIRDLLASIELIQLGDELCMVGFLSDVTERKQLEVERAAALARIAAVEEQERHRLSRELHDQTAQQLVALAVELKNLETNLAAGRPQGERVRALRQAVDGLQQQVRQIAWDLRAGELAEGDWESALREYVEEWSDRTQIAVDCECRGLGVRLPAPVEAVLYRVTQEALANVEKHAGARRVGVVLDREGALVRLAIEDDGRGFDVDAVRKPTEGARRLGLLSMRERVTLAGGTFLVESSPAAGTAVLVRIPIPAAARPALGSEHSDQA